MTLQHRAYQKKAISDIYRLIRDGITSILQYAPTGAGKTVIATQIMVDAVSKGRRVLFICHRTKLVGQTQETLQKLGIDAGIIWADYPTNPNAPVQIAMAQTLVGRNLPENIDLLIVDEAHSLVFWKIVQDAIVKYSGDALKPSACFEKHGEDYKPQIKEAMLRSTLETFTPGKFIHIGLSASPFRRKTKEGFCQFYQAVVETPQISALIQQGYLSRYRLFSRSNEIDFSKLEVRQGDYTEESMRVALDDKYNAVVVKNYLEICPNKKAIVFCGSVAQAKNLTEQFLEKGLSTELVIGSTPETPDREDIYDRFKVGSTQIIVSVGCLTEGFDEPSVECVIIARPTRFIALLIQMLGRGLRISPGKDEVFLLDFGECFKRVWHPGLPLKIGLCPRFKGQEFELDLKECPNCGAMLSQFLKFCPECGHHFASKPPETTQPFKLEEFLTPQQRKQIKFIRKVQSSSYQRGVTTSTIKSIFRKEFGFYPPEDWLVGAIFNGELPYENYLKYRDFLLKLHPNSSDVWLKYMLAQEFGTPGKRYQKADGKSYIAPEVVISKCWYEILEVSVNSNWSEIAESYKALVAKTLPENKDTLQLLTYAMEVAYHAKDSAS